MKGELTDLQHILQHIAMLSDLPEPSSLKRLVGALRVADGDEEAANAKIDELIEVLRENPEYGAGLAAFVLRLTNQYNQMRLYTDTGIASDHSFSHSMNRLIGHRFLPLLPDENSVVELADYLFDHRNDLRWLRSIKEERWDSLVELLRVDAKDLGLVATAKNSILNAIVILSYRISGMGLHPDLMDAYPQMLNHSAAFVAQNQEAVLFVNQYRKAHELDSLTDVKPEEDVSPAPLLVMLEQCENIVTNVRKRIYKTGISIRVTNILVRLEQSLHRLELLIELVTDSQKRRDTAVVELMGQVAYTAKTRYSFGRLIENNTKLLSRKVTENASRVGEHYISTDKAGYRKMYKKAAIGGFFIAFMATIKILGSRLVLAPIGNAFMNSMIYGLGFVVIHIAHGTVATKQPAMTAAAIASTISEGKGSGSRKTQQLTKLSELIVDILRTQFVAILGNISIAMPLAFAIAYGWLHYYGVPMIDGKKAAHLLHDLNPFESLSLPHAAIAGVYLFLSGLISGYYDNLAAYNKIGERLRRHRLLSYLMPSTWQTKLGDFVEANLGAIMGNFIFGCFLGSTATIGYMLGLPLDIRHIAFASANFVHGLFYLSPADLTWQLALISFIGVLLIGMVNLMVSFSLALFVALRSKEVEFFEWKKLNGLVFAHFLVRPFDFILPRNESVKYSQIDSEGRVIYEDTPDEKEPQTRVLSDNYVVRRLGILGKKKDKEKEKEAEKAADVPAELAEQTDGKSEQKSEDYAGATNHLPKPDKPPKLPK
ncbi:recombinase [Moraxella caviae]|uniref:Recombinase n=1 Tax=Moraxella caviae TaxID=34060 RepID=A0A1T0A2E6_9GAMM|nr:site-specific recombinase [Moraxella caviae]OOR89894.1 recombinase [Moraxella caviae]STZ14278.1 Site-specific recombinase [Moraxella caviae]VEW10736.1 Site-specific recombinase [Moraxella caviae]